MSIWQSFKKWALKPDAAPVEAPKQEAPVVNHSDMVGEPVTSFIASIRREPKRYKLEEVPYLQEWDKVVLTYPRYHWMNGKVYKLLDRKNGNTYHAYVQRGQGIYEVCDLQFKLNGWELKALWEEFKLFRLEARTRKKSMLEARGKRLRLEAIAEEKFHRQRLAEQFK